MKRSALLAAFLALPLALAAQTTNSTASIMQPANGPADIAGQLYAANFAHWTASPTPSGTRWDNAGQCYATSGGITFPMFSTTAPITIVDLGVPANTETVTPTQVGYLGSGCNVSLPATHSHSNYYLKSGTVGLQEALNWGGTNYYQVVLTPDWTTMGGTAGMISAAVLCSNETILDQRSTITYSTVTAAAAPGNVRALVGSVATSGASYANGSNNITGIRGSATIAAATTASTGYVYGTQGKLIVTGTVSGSTWDAGLMGQTDISAATLTSASHVTPIWSDAGATGPTVSCTFCDSLVLTNTTATTFHSLIYGYSKAAYFLDLTDNGGGYIIAGSGASSAVTGYLKVKIAGADAYIRVYAGAS